MDVSVWDEEHFAYVDAKPFEGDVELWRVGLVDVGKHGVDLERGQHGVLHGIKAKDGVFDVGPVEPLENACNVGRDLHHLFQRRHDAVRFRVLRKVQAHDDHGVRVHVLVLDLPVERGPVGRVFQPRNHLARKHVKLVPRALHGYLGLGNGVLGTLGPLERAGNHVVDPPVPAVLVVDLPRPLDARKLRHPLDPVVHKVVDADVAVRSNVLAQPERNVPRLAKQHVVLPQNGVLPQPDPVPADNGHKVLVPQRRVVLVHLLLGLNGCSNRSLWRRKHDQKVVRLGQDGQRAVRLVDRAADRPHLENQGRKVNNPILARQAREPRHVRHKHSDLGLVPCPNRIFC